MSKPLAGKRYFRAMGQRDAALGRRKPVHLMRWWSQWMFDAYAWGHIQTGVGMKSLRQQLGKPEGQ